MHEIYTYKSIIFKILKLSPLALNKEIGYISFMWFKLQNAKVIEVVIEFINRVIHQFQLWQFNLICVSSTWIIIDLAILWKFIDIQKDLLFELEEWIGSFKFIQEMIPFIMAWLLTISDLNFTNYTVLKYAIKEYSV